MWTIVVAGGGGSRFGGPKQYAALAGQRVLDWYLAAAGHASHGVVLVVPAAQAEVPEPGADTVVAGGRTRSESVRCGLAAVPEVADVVVVHDGARPAAAARPVRSGGGGRRRRRRCGGAGGGPGRQHPAPRRRCGRPTRWVAVQTPQARGVGPTEGGGPEGLRRLHRHQGVADAPLRIVAPAHGVDQGHPRHGGVGAVAHGGRPPQRQVGPGHGAGAVVDDHHLGLVGHDKPGSDRGGAGRAAGHHRVGRGFGPRRGREGPARTTPVWPAGPGRGHAPVEDPPVPQRGVLLGAPRSASRRRGHHDRPHAARGAARYGRQLPAGPATEPGHAIRRPDLGAGGVAVVPASYV